MIAFASGMMAEVGLDRLWLVFAIAVWGIVHSWLASLGVKAQLRRILGTPAARLYRLAYNIFAVLTFLPILWLTVALPDAPLYRVPAPWSYLLYIGQAVALLLLFAGVIQTGLMSFAGLSQLTEPDRPAALVTGGLYGVVRHPLYSAGLLFLWLSPAMTVNRFTLYLASSLYLVIGAVFEERKLLREFGSPYQEYRRSTPMFVPGLRLRP